MNKSKANGVSWVKPTEPSFLKKFKNDVGYKEAPTVDTKHQAMPTLDDDSGSDREDELPQVVILKTGDLTAEEVKKFRDKTDGAKKDDDKAPPDGRIMFKKPAKRSSSEKSDMFQSSTANSSKKRRSYDGNKKEKKKEESSTKKVKNTSLLSFGDDEDEDED